MASISGDRLWIEMSSRRILAVCGRPTASAIADDPAFVYIGEGLGLGISTTASPARRRLTSRVCRYRSTTGLLRTRWFAQSCSAERWECRRLFALPSCARRETPENSEAQWLRVLKMGPGRAGATSSRLRSRHITLRQAGLHMRDPYRYMGTIGHLWSNCI